MNPTWIRWAAWGLWSLGLVGCAPHVIVLHDPLPAEAHNDLALRYMEEGAWKAAERALRRAIRKAPTWPVPYMNLGFLYARQGRWEDAFRAYARAVRIDGTCADCLNNLAWSALRSGRRRSLATAWVRRALALGGPERFRYHHTAAWVAYTRGDCAAALQEMAAALAGAPPAESFLYGMDADRMGYVCAGPDLYPFR
jgi:Tfp pilus assembly protein PilF